MSDLPHDSRTAESREDAATQVAVQIRNLEMSYGSSVVIDGLDLDFLAGEITCILGPSGCGKSTILRMLGELAHPTTGEIEVLGRSPAQAWSDLAFVFQAPRLVPWRTALGNVLLGMELRGIKGNRAELRQQAMEAMSTVGVAHLADRRAHVLSGGEQQRVSIARAMAVKPRLLLMDEPFSALDVQTRRALRQEIVSLWQRTGISIIFVTHDIDEALIVGSRLVVFSAKPTNLLAEMEVKIAKPADPGQPEFVRLHDEVVQMFASDSAAADELTGASS